MGLKMRPPEAAESIAKTILIVDDVPANLAVVSRHLEDHGYRAVVAQSGSEAIERAELVRPNLILLDVLMPGIDGFETCRRLKASENTRDIPVVFMTALTDAADKLAGFEAGAVDYVTKPLDGPEVRARIDTHLSLYALRHELQRQNAQLREEIAAREQVQEALQRSNTELEECGAEVTRGPLPVVMADAMQFAQLFRNLLGNAIKFRSIRPPQVRIEAERADAGWCFAAVARFSRTSSPGHWKALLWI